MVKTCRRRSIYTKSLLPWVYHVKPDVNQIKLARSYRYLKELLILTCIELELIGLVNNFQRSRDAEF